MISIIIPTYNEENIIEESLIKLKEQEGDYEIIVADSGNDKTKEIASKYVKVITTKKGRANQLNAGVEEAKGDILLFIHADAVLPINAIKEIEKIRKEEYVGGGFYIKFKSKKKIFRLIEFRSNKLRVNFTKSFLGAQEYS